MVARALPLAAALLLAPALAQAAAEPYVQEEPYLLLPGCCTFGFQEGDRTFRLVVRDLTGALGLALGAKADLHDAGHGPLGVLRFCGDSGEVAIPPTADHVHVYPYDAPTNLALCGPRTALAPTAGAVEARMNGA